jgi:hypothetical protein
MRLTRLLFTIGVLVCLAATMTWASGGKTEVVVVSMYAPGPGPMAGERAVEEALAKITLPATTPSRPQFISWTDWYDGSV